MWRSHEGPSVTRGRDGRVSCELIGWTNEGRFFVREVDPGRPGGSVRGPGRVGRVDDRPSPHRSVQMGRSLVDCGARVARVEDGAAGPGRVWRDDRAAGHASHARGGTRARR